MPNHLAEGTVRVSYVEDTETITTLRLLAMAEHTNVSALVREATKNLLESYDPKKQFNEVAAALAEKAEEARKTASARKVNKVVKILKKK